jgi:hypothetical protein
MQNISSLDSESSTEIDSDQELEGFFSTVLNEARKSNCCSKKSLSLLVEILESSESWIEKGVIIAEVFECIEAKKHTLRELIGTIVRNSSIFCRLVYALSKSNLKKVKDLHDSLESHFNNLASLERYGVYDELGLLSDLKTEWNQDVTSVDYINKILSKEFQEWIESKFLHESSSHRKKRVRIDSKVAFEELKGALLSILCRVSDSILTPKDRYEVDQAFLDRLIIEIKSRGLEKELETLSKETSLTNKILLFPYLQKKGKSNLLNSIKDGENLFSLCEGQKINSLCKNLTLVSEYLGFLQGIEIVPSIMDNCKSKEEALVFFNFLSKRINPHIISSKDCVVNTIPIVIASCKTFIWDCLLCHSDWFQIRHVLEKGFPKDISLISKFCSLVIKNISEFTKTNSIEDCKVFPVSSMERIARGVNFADLENGSRRSSRVSLEILNQPSPLLLALYSLDCSEDMKAFLIKVLPFLNDKIGFVCCAFNLSKPGGEYFIKKAFGSVSRSSRLSILTLQISDRRELVELSLEEEGGSLEGKLEVLRVRLKIIKEKNNSKGNLSQEDKDDFSNSLLALSIEAKRMIFFTKYHKKIFEYAQEEGVLFGKCSHREYFESIFNDLSSEALELEYQINPPVEEVDTSEDSWGVESVWQLLRERDLYVNMTGRSPFYYSEKTSFDILKDVGLKDKEDFVLLGFCKYKQTILNDCTSYLQKLKISEIGKKRLSSFLNRFIDVTPCETKGVISVESVRQDENKFVEFCNRIRALEEKVALSRESFVDILKEGNEEQYNEFMEKSLMVLKESNIYRMISKYYNQVASFEFSWSQLHLMGIHSLSHLADKYARKGFDPFNCSEFFLSLIQINENKTSLKVKA